MKTLTKVIVCALLAIAVGFGVHYVLRQMGILMDPDADPTQLAGNAMTTARAMFTEKPDEIQILTAAIQDMSGLELLAGEDGGVYSPTAGSQAPIRTVFPDVGEVGGVPGAEAQAALEAVFGDYECGGKVLQVLVKEDAVLFYTAFPRDGCAGFLYEKELGATNYYDYVELVENWKIFYRIPVQ